MSRVNLLGLDLAALTAYTESLGEKPFRARQLAHWIHRRGAGGFDAMSDLAKSFRSKLAEHAEIVAPGVLRDSTSSDGTRKWLLDVGAGNAIETVFIPEDGSRHAVHLDTGGLRGELPVLLDRSAGLQPQPDDGRDRRATVVGRARAAQDGWPRMPTASA